jgi:multiple sugar transport system permease protein
LDKGVLVKPMLDTMVYDNKMYAITIPLLLPTLAFVLIIALIASFQVFDQVYVMTRGGPLFRTETLVQYIYLEGFQHFRLGYSAALAFVLLLIILVLTLIQMRYFRSGLSGR